MATQRCMSSGPSLHVVPPSRPLTSDLLLTKARKPRSRLADELREPWDSLRKAEFGAPPASSRGDGAVSRTAPPPYTPFSTARWTPLEPSRRGLTRLGATEALVLRGLPKLQGSSLETEPPGNVVVTGYFGFHRFTNRRKGAFSKLAQTPTLTLVCGLRPSPLRKDLRSGRPPEPSAEGWCPNSSTPSGSDFPGFSFGFCGWRKGAGSGPDPSLRADRGHNPTDLRPAHRLPLPLVRTFLVESGLPGLEEPGSRRGRPSASARRHSRYSGDLTKRA